MSPLSPNLQEIVEYRGVEGLVAAEVLTDDDTNGYTTGPVFAIAGVAEISRSTDSSNEAHYYDNMPAVVISSTAADEVTITASAIPLDVYAEITGQGYDSTLGALIEGPRDFKYFAIGYKTRKTNGDEVYVWRYKGTFNIPEQTNSTENDSTDANGQEIVFTGISTTHKFTANSNKGAKALCVDVAKGLADVTNFFDTVTTPDSLANPDPAPTYKLTIVQASNTTVTVKKGSTTLSNGATITLGDVLTITVSGGTVEVNGQPFVSGATTRVTSSVVVVSTASA
jgi:phi13 family phage major tail protein